jgi:hypothetical protein
MLACLLCNIRRNPNKNLIQKFFFKKYRQIKKCVILQCRMNKDMNVYKHIVWLWWWHAALIAAVKRYGP